MPRVQRGKLGAAKRWGERRVVRLDGLDPVVRRVILNLIETSERIAREKAAAEGQSPATADAEVSGATLDPAA